MIPILLVHAAGGAARNFGSVVRRLPGALALDLPGHGRAGGEALRTIEAMAAYALERAPEGALVLGGHSMGGAVALTAAVRAPERVRGLVLIGTGARLGMSAAVAAKARTDFEGFLAALAASGSPPMTIQALRDAGAETVARDLEASTGWSGIELAREVRVPALLVAGGRDRVAPPARVRELARALPDAHVAVIEGAGHVLPVERPDEVAREVAAFLARLEGSAAADR